MILMKNNCNISEFRKKKRMPSLATVEARLSRVQMAASVNSHPADEPSLCSQSTMAAASIYVYEVFFFFSSLIGLYKGK